jgi:uncharacterized membrane protein YgcG
MKYLLSITIALLGFLSSITFAATGDFDAMAMPALTEYVADFSNSMTSSQLAEVRQIAYDYFSGTSTQIATVLFPHR